jgi:hypothetical protein
MGFQWPFRHLIASGVPEAGALLATKKKSHLEHAIASAAPAASFKSLYH